jgi:predicted regulator of Ras-like GTPase activity (Roadblock/LC7/MglB family)
MGKMTESSEFAAAVKIANELVAQAAVAMSARKVGHRALTVHPKPSASFAPGPSQERIAAALAPNARLLKEEPVPGPAAATDEAAIARPSRLAAPASKRPQAAMEGIYRGDKLSNALYAMCQRGGFSGALIVDDNGLPLAVHQSPVPEEAIGAFAIVLGTALAKAGKLLGQHNAENISIDINYTEKIVLRRFAMGQSPGYLLVICPQEVDERGEVELSIEQIAQILKRT